MDKMKSIPIILLIMFTGCFTTKTPVTPAIKPHVPTVDVQSQVVMVGSVKEAIDTSAAFVIADAQSVKTGATSILALNPPENMLQLIERIGINAGNIDKNARIILSESDKLSGVQTELAKVKDDYAALQKDFSDSQKQVKERDAAIAKANVSHAEEIKRMTTANTEEIKKRDEELAKLKDAVTAKLKMWLLIATLTFMGLGAAAVGFGIYLEKPKLFVFAPVFIGCASLTYFCAQYLKEILIFGGIAFAGLVGYSIWRWKMEQDDLKDHKLALEEEVSTIEQIPDEVWAGIKTLFKDNVSAPSQKLIELARVELKSKGVIK